MQRQQLNERESFFSCTQRAVDEPGLTDLQELDDHRRPVFIENFRGRIKEGEYRIELFPREMELCIKYLDLKDGLEENEKLQLRIFVLPNGHGGLTHGAFGHLEIVGHGEGGGYLSFTPSVMKNIIENYPDTASLVIFWTWWRLQPQGPDVDLTKPEYWATCLGLKGKDLPELLAEMGLDSAAPEDAGSVAGPLQRPPSARVFTRVYPTVAETCAAFIVLAKQHIGLEEPMAALHLGDVAQAPAPAFRDFSQKLREVELAGAFEDRNGVKFQVNAFPKYKIVSSINWREIVERDFGLAEVVAAGENDPGGLNLFVGSNTALTMGQVLKGERPFQLCVLRGGRDAVVVSTASIPKGSCIELFAGVRELPNPEDAPDGENWVVQRRHAVPVECVKEQQMAEKFEELRVGYEEGSEIPDNDWFIVPESKIVANKMGGALRWASVGVHKNIGRVEVHLPFGTTVSVRYALVDIPAGTEMVR